MKRVAVYSLIAVVLAAAFVAGFLVQDVRANGFALDKLAASVELMPQRLETLAGEAPDPSSRTLPLIETYSAVMDRLKSDYYGTKTIDEQEITYDAIRGTLQALGDPFTPVYGPGIL